VAPNVLRFGEDEEPDDLTAVNSELGSPKDTRAVTKASKLTIKAMLTPWMAGASYAELADLFDLPSPAAARQAIEKALVESAPDTINDRPMLVKKVSMTLDMLQRSIMMKALDGNNPDQRGYLDTVLKIVDRKAALFGLNAPSTMLIAAPGDDELRSFVEQLAVASGAELPEESDPFVEMVMDEETGEWAPRE
jgi:hypothetical protein